MLLPLHILRYVTTYLKSTSRADFTVSRRWYVFAQNLPVVLKPTMAKPGQAPILLNEVPLEK